MSPTDTSNTPSDPAHSNGPTAEAALSGDRRRRRVGARLVRHALLIGLVVMAASTVVSVAIEYARGTRRMEEHLNNIPETEIAAITESVWIADNRMLATHLVALIRQPFVSHAAVYSDQDGIVSVGARPSERHAIVRQYELIYGYDGRDRAIGMLRVFADRGVVLNRAVGVGLLASIYPAITIAVVGFFLYVGFHRIVIRRLIVISDFLRSFDTRYEERSLKLPSGPSRRGYHDELDEVADAVESLRISLNQRHEELQRAYEVVSREVDAKTRELQLTNRTLQQQIEELEKTKAELTSANESKTMFLANVSHELRTPLTGIIGLAGLFERTEMDETQHRYTSAIRDSAGSLLALVDDLLDFSKVEADRIEISRAPMHVRSALAALMQLFQPSADRNDCTLESQVAEEVPEVIVADSLRIQQVLRNLVANAIKFTPGGRVRVALEVVGGAGGDATEPPTGSGRLIRFVVEDNGIGISDAAKPRLFESFYQGGGPDAGKHTGTGLGLAISKRLVIMMGGEIGVESTEGEGSTFSFTLPLAVAAEAEEAEPGGRAGHGDDAAGSADSAAMEREAAAGGRAAGPAAEGIDEPPRPLNVLLGEDNAINRLYLEHLLRLEGHNVTVAADGYAVLDALELADFDVILMDIQMPGLDGVETTRRIRGSSDVPIVALTAYARESDIAAFMEAGMTTVVTKPIRERELRRVLAEVVS